MSCNFAAALLPVARPRLPPAAAIMPYLQEIDAAAWYSNHGPLAVRLQGRLATHWGVDQQNVVTLSNATAGLTLTLLASGVRPGQRCLMPSWTFAASAGSVVAAGLIPHFVDILPGSWAPDPAMIEHLARQPDVGAILVVAPFGAPLDLATWDDLHRRTGVPVIIDAAAAFDTLQAGGPMPVGACPLVVSLHATKVFGVGEGGALVCRDADLVQRVRALAQFGFAGSRSSQTAGVNAKISEYTAAVGLAGFDCWDETRARWERITHAYRAMLPHDVVLAPQFGQGWVASTLTVLWPEHCPDLGEALAAEGVGTVFWWGRGCHAQPAYARFMAEPLPMTQLYADRAIGLPFWQDLSEAQIASVCDSLGRVLGRSDQTRPVRSAAFELSRTG